VSIDIFRNVLDDAQGVCPAAAAIDGTVAVAYAVGAVFRRNRIAGPIVRPILVATFFHMDFAETEVVFAIAYGMDQDPVLVEFKRFGANIVLKGAPRGTSVSPSSE
jgi:hypothetical protein